VANARGIEIMNTCRVQVCRWEPFSIRKFSTLLYFLTSPFNLLQICKTRQLFYGKVQKYKEQGWLVDCHASRWFSLHSWYVYI
jgi:hypothetical protein